MADPKESPLFQWLRQQQGDIERLQALARLFLISLLEHDAVRSTVLSNINTLLEGEWRQGNLSGTERAALEDLKAMIEEQYGSI